MKTATKKEIKSRPIIFTHNIDKILSGEKTQTRRIVKDPPVFFTPDKCQMIVESSHKASVGNWLFSADIHCHEVRCPYGKVGDLLYVKENWGYHGQSTYGSKHEATVSYSDNSRRDVSFRSFNKMIEATPKQNLRYPDNWDEMNYDEQKWCKSDLLDKWWDKQKKKSPVFMPRWASRINLEITNIKVERLATISTADAVREGMEPYCDPDRPSAIDQFEKLWKQINGKESWNQNPFVWVIEFKKV